MRLSAGLTIVGLAMALLGPAPAVTICFLSRILDAILTDGIRLRGRRLALVWNLGMYVGVLIGSLIIQAAVDAGVSPESAGFALVVVGAISVANVINFVLAAIWIRVHAGAPIAHAASSTTSSPRCRGSRRRTSSPARSSRSTSAPAPTSLLLSLALVGAFYVLLAELLNSQQRRDELEQRTLELASLQVGVLVTMVRTLSLRDRFTARHSAAVARYAHAIAEAAGCSEDELRTVHTAGLLHDIGKFAFPDRILLATGGLQDGGLRASCARIPAQGAELVRRVQGLEEIAERSSSPTTSGSTATAIRSGLRGEEIPALAADDLGRRRLRRDDRSRHLPHAGLRRRRRSPSCAGCPARSSTRASSSCSSASSSASRSASPTPRTPTSRPSSRSSSASASWRDRESRPEVAVVAGLRAALVSAEFRALLISYVINRAGDVVGALALAVVVLAATGSALATAALFLATQFVPGLIGPGIVARIDRAAPGRILPALYVVECVLFLLLAADRPPRRGRADHRARLRRRDAGVRRADDHPLCARPRRWSPTT